LGQPGVYSDEDDESASFAFLSSMPTRVCWACHVARGLDDHTWTLVSNTGVAVNPALSYAVVDGQLVAEELVPNVFGEGATITRRVPGTDLVGLKYQRPFDELPAPGGADGWRVVPADYVTTDEGTGLVHLAPAFGEIDRQAAREHAPHAQPGWPDGRFTDAIGWLAGRAVREANHDINDRLEAPACCSAASPTSTPTPLLALFDAADLLGKPSWYIATQSKKRDLLAANAGVDWHPSNIRDGRFGEWLENNVDWALSRDRFWGTPLPIWRCGGGHVFCVGSLAELSELCGRDVTASTPHRPTSMRSLCCPDCADPASDATSPTVRPLSLDGWRR